MCGWGKGCPGGQSSQCKGPGDRRFLACAGGLRGRCGGTHSDWLGALDGVRGRGLCDSTKPPGSLRVGPRTSVGGNPPAPERILSKETWQKPNFSKNIISPRPTGAGFRGSVTARPLTVETQCGPGVEQSGFALALHPLPAPPSRLPGNEGRREEEGGEAAPAVPGCACDTCVAVRECDCVQVCVQECAHVACCATVRPVSGSPSPS